MSAAGSASWEAMNTFGTHLERMLPDTWKSFADEFVVPMTNDPACRGDDVAKRLIRAEDSGNPGSELDALLLGFAYAIEAEHACRAGHEADAWPALLLAERINGLLVGASQAMAGRPLLGQSLAALDQRRAEMQALRVKGNSDAKIASVFHVSRQRVLEILGPKAKRQ
jgi:hypothetical protein